MYGRSQREYSKLMLLFQFCHLCLFPNPKVAVTQTGTMLSIVTECSKCGETYTWKSQPDLMGRFPAGNLLLSFAVLCAGASIRKVLLVFRHMGVLAFHEPTYYYHQRHLLIPSIVALWKKYQSRLLEKLKNKEVVLAGDGSLGHSAKYSTLIHNVLLYYRTHHPYSPCESMYVTLPSIRLIDTYGQFNIWTSILPHYVNWIIILLLFQKTAFSCICLGQFYIIFFLKHLKWEFLILTIVEF